MGNKHNEHAKDDKGDEVATDDDAKGTQSMMVGTRQTIQMHWTMVQIWYVTYNVFNFGIYNYFYFTPITFSQHRKVSKMPMTNNNSHPGKFG
jgi:hypothetical protein